MDAISKPAPTTTQPRLSIIHLMGWTLGCSVVLAGFRWMTIDANVQAEVDWQFRLAQLGFSLTYGTALGGLGLLFWRRFYGGYPFPTQPGHWLLVIGGIGCLIDGGISLPLALYVRWAQQQQIEVSVTVHYVQRAIGWGIAGAIGLAILWQLKSSRRWWVLTALLVLVLLANASCWAWMATYYQWSVQTGRGVANWAFIIPLTSECIGAVICLLALTAVVWLDSRSRDKRDWLHWAGVGTALCLAMLHVAMTTWSLAWWL